MEGLEVELVGAALCAALSAVGQWLASAVRRGYHRMYGPLQTERSEESIEDPSCTAEV